MRLSESKLSLLNALRLDGCDTLPEGIRGIQDVHLIWDALEARGYGKALLEDIFCNNLLRVLPAQD